LPGTSARKKGGRSSMLIPGYDQIDSTDPEDQVLPIHAWNVSCKYPHHSVCQETQEDSKDA
jgi:hypothetical protein